MSSTLLVIGKTGQVARALKAELGDGAIFLGREELDLAQPEKVAATLAAYSPTAIINAAAYTLVDKAESEEALATAINATSVGEVAAFCAARGIPLVHYSTDYVFAGNGETPWKETDATGPLSAYGRSKLAGEQAIAASGCKHLILRTSWVYDADGKNFVNTMLRFGAEREEMKVVADQFGAPSYAPHLAQATLAALANAQALHAFPSGIYHFCNAGVTSWHGFAQAIFNAARALGLPVAVKNLLAITTAEYPTPAARPANSRMDCSKLKQVVSVTLPDWQDGLNACMEHKRESNRLSA